MDLERSEAFEAAGAAEPDECLGKRFLLGDPGDLVGPELDARIGPERHRGVLDWHGLRGLPTSFDDE